MLELLTCVSEVGTLNGCCTEPPYEIVQPDCVELCLVRAMEPTRKALLEKFYSSAAFGEGGCMDYLVQMQDLSVLKRLVVVAFEERMRDFFNDADSGQELYWSLYGMSCWVDYFRCQYGINIKPWLLTAGFYDPAYSVPETEEPLPLPILVPCGVVEPPEPPELLPWPPDCNLEEPTYTVDHIIDAAGLAGIVTGGSVITALIISDVGGLGLPEAPPHQITTWDGLSWTPGGPLTPGDTIGGPASEYYFTLADATVANYFPALIGQTNDNVSPCTLTLVSTYPAFSILGTRGVLVEASVDGVSWDVVLSNVTEQQLAVPLIVQTDCSGYLFTRITYFNEFCIYGPYIGPVTAAPGAESIASFELRSEDGVSDMCLSTAPTVHPINYLDDEHWTLSFWFKGDSLAIDDVNVLASLQAFTFLSPSAPIAGQAFGNLRFDNLWLAGLSLNMSFGQANGVGQLFGFLDDSGSTLYMPFDPTEWHHYCIVRNGPLVLTPGQAVNQMDVFKLFVDGNLIPDARVWSTNFTPVSDWPSFPTGQAAQGLVVGASSIYGLGTALNGEICLGNMDEIYVCKTSRTDNEVLNKIYTNQMEIEDASWDRVLWWRAEGDVAGASGVNSNSTLTPNATMQGNVFVDTGEFAPIP